MTRGGGKGALLELTGRGTAGRNARWTATLDGYARQLHWTLEAFLSVQAEEERRERKEERALGRWGGA